MLPTVVLVGVGRLLMSEALYDPGPYGPHAGYTGTRKTDPLAGGGGRFKARLPLTDQVVFTFISLSLSLFLSFSFPLLSLLSLALSLS